MHHLRNFALLLLTLPVTLTSPTPASLHSREAEPFWAFSKSKGASSSSRAAEASSSDAEAAAAPEPLYAANGRRLHAGVVALDSERRHVLVMRPTESPEWSLPIGDQRESDQTVSEALRRPATQAGVSGEYTGLPMGRVLLGDQTQIDFYLIRNAQTQEHWPESAGFARAWVTYSEARTILDPGQLERVENSGIDQQYSDPTPNID